jgi:hypothetical protein
MAPGTDSQQIGQFEMLPDRFATCRINFVLSELLIWTKYLQYALQRMYEVAEEKDAMKKDLAVAEGVSHSSRATAVATTSNRSDYSGRTDQNIPH